MNVPTRPNRQVPLEKILVAEDEESTREVIVQVLVRAGYRVIEAVDGAAALRLLAEEHPALVVIDVNMPEMGGFTVVETMRRRGLTQPVLILTGCSGMDHRVKGLGLGADDYMTKPFDARELHARVAALLRRTKKAAAMPRQLRNGGVTVDLEAKRADRAGEPIALTATEFSILELLAREAGRPVSTEQILDSVWGYNLLPNTRTVATHIWRLRKKLLAEGETGWIENKHGLGYVLAAECLETRLAPGKSTGSGEPQPQVAADAAVAS